MQRSYLRVSADEDIGVITPYHAQCVRIRSILRPIADGVKVGSVEEFQGQVSSDRTYWHEHHAKSILRQERKVIIMSTVRSSPEFVQYDLKHTLGFLANPRRLNGMWAL